MWKLCVRDWSHSVFMGNVKILYGDILFSHCQTLVVPVSCHGIILGEAGLRYIRKYPEMVRKYQSLCERELLRPGLLWIYRGTKHLIMTMPVCNANELIDLDVIRQSFDKLLATYEDKGITSLAIPLYHDDHSTVNGQLMKDLLMTFLNRCTIPVEIYEKYVPQSSKMVPLLERLCGPLSEEKVYELKKKICFECD